MLPEWRADDFDGPFSAFSSTTEQQPKCKAQYQAKQHAEQVQETFTEAFGQTIESAKGPSLREESKRHAVKVSHQTIVVVERTSGKPSGAPLTTPLSSSSGSPSNRPSVAPSSKPTATKSANPSRRPSSRLSKLPSTKPAVMPSSRPSKSAHPSKKPSLFPLVLSLHPNQAKVPSQSPTKPPSGMPSASPSRQPSTKPTAHTFQPTKFNSCLRAQEICSLTDECCSAFTCTKSVQDIVPT
jgi:hypothetical protein